LHLLKVLLGVLCGNFALFLHLAGPHKLCLAYLVTRLCSLMSLIELIELH